MPLETATYFSDLVTSNPAHSDGLNQADAHMRLLKAVIRNSFPNINAAVTSTPAQLNQVGTAGSSGAPSVNFGGTTEGFYKFAAAQIGITGQLEGNGAVRTGSVQMFVGIPPNANFTWANGGNSSAFKYEYLEMDGGVYLSSTYPELASAILSLPIGSLPSNFTVPNMTGTGKFPRARFPGAGFLVPYSNQVGAHVHSATFTGNAQGDHSHSATDAGHRHFTVANDLGFGAVEAGTSSGLVGGGGVGGPITAFDLRGSVFTGLGNASISVGNAGGFTPSGSVSVASTGGSETRPEAMSFLFFVKT